MNFKRIFSAVVLITMMLFSTQSFAAGKIGLLIGYNSASEVIDDDEVAAVNWFTSNYTDGVIITPNTLDKIKEVTTLWVAIDRTGIGAGWANLPEAFRSNSVITAITDHVKAGGSLLLTNHATQLTVAIGRISDQYRPGVEGVFGDGNAANQNPDLWGSHPVIGNIEGQIYDHKDHAIYNGMTYRSDLFAGIYPFIGAGGKEDHNCMWDLNKYGLSASPNIVADFENKTNSTVLGTWNHVEDYCCAGIVDFAPTTEYKGHVLAIGLAAYEWFVVDENKNDRQMEKFTGNCLSYLESQSTKTISGGGDPDPDPTPDPTPDPDPTPGGDDTPVSTATNAAIFIGYESISAIEDDDEKAAAEWFAATYPDGTIFTPSNIGTLTTENAKTLWIPVDRVGLTQGANNLPAAYTNAKATIKDFLKNGGMLLLTNHATQMVNAIGRISSSYAPTIYGNAAGESKDETWGTNPNLVKAYNHSSHAIYNGLTSETFNNNDAHESYPYFPLIGNGWKEDHNCMWDMNAIGVAANPNKIKDFENKTSSTVLGTWQQVVDDCCAGIVEFGPTTKFGGTVIAIGQGAYEWKQNNGNNTYLDNVKKLTKNAIDYLLNVVPQEISGGDEPVDAGERKIWIDMTLDGDHISDKVSGSSLFVDDHKAQRENIAGAAGMALRCDGYSTFASGDIDVSELSDEKMTVAVWAAPESYPMGNNNDGFKGDDQYFFAGNRNGNSGFGFFITPLGHYGFKYGNNELTVYNETMPQYEWSHLVVTIDADGDAILYRNGVKKADNWGATIDTGGSSFFIGKPRENLKVFDRYHANAFNGLIDDFEVYNKVLSESEIEAYTPQNEADLTIPASRHGNDIMHPQVHPMAATGWGNETHGAMYSNGKFHVFYQKNPNGAYWGRLHWGHLVSPNMIDWFEERTAIIPDQLGYDAKGCWSGHIYKDASINGGKPTIVYTSVTGVPSISEATADDNDLKSWTKLGSNPRIKPLNGFGDFRDPSFFTANGNKYLVVGTTKDGNGAASLHKYENGNWTNNGTALFVGNNVAKCGSFWEMPNVTKVGDKYLVTVTPLPSGFDGGVKTIYWLGDINGNGQFTPTSSSTDNPSYLELEGMSKVGYGLLSPTFFEHEGKVLMLGIVPDKLSVEQSYNLGWAHTFCLPREITLSADRNSICQKPYEGLQKMRTSTKSETLTNFNLNGAKSLAPVSGRQIEICGEFTAAAGARFGYNFYKNGGKTAQLYYDVNARKVVVDFANTDHWTMEEGDFFHGHYESEEALNINPGEKVKLHLFVDHSIIDVFVNDKYAFCIRMFIGDNNANDVEVFANGSTLVNSLQAWNIDKTGEYAGIDMIEDHTEADTEAAKDNIYYDLMGRRLNGKPQRGLYILNGKKYVVKN